MHYKDVMEYEVKTGLKPSYMTSFKSGAQWKEKQIMSEAVGGWVSNTLNHDIRVTSEWMNEKKHPFKFGDKVKLIIIKEK